MVNGRKRRGRKCLDLRRSRSPQYNIIGPQACTRKLEHADGVGGTGNDTVTNARREIIGGGQGCGNGVSVFAERRSPVQLIATGTGSEIR